MTKTRLKWKPVKDDSPVYLEEAAQLLGTTYEALRARVHRMMNEGRTELDLPTPSKDEWGRWCYNRQEFMALVKYRAKIDAIVKGSGKG